ncbi:MAG: hypothetical protein DMD81_02760, partial [Candidatus Rokuibacteriota bacterium]
VYEGSPEQTVAIDVNGRFQTRLALKREWAQYQVTIPGTALQSGLNGVTFKYGYAVAPARVIPGNADTRELAVAFNSVALRRADSR